MRHLLWTVLLLAACSGGGGPATGTPSPDPDTTRTVTGRVGYVSTGPDLSNIDGNGRLIPQGGLGSSTFAAPAPRIRLEVLGDDGRVIGTGVTNNAGEYSIFCNFGQKPATPVRIRSTATASLPFGMDISVYANESSTAPYTYTSAAGGTPGDNRFEVMRVDVDIPTAAGAAAFHIVDVLYEGFAFGRAGLLPGALLPDLLVQWEPGNGAATVLTPGLEFATLKVAGGESGDPTSNTDAWDDAVLMRFVGQYMIDYFLWEVRPEGIANDARLVPSAAWVEGLLDWYSCAARGSQIYWDTEGSGDDGRVTRYFDIESFFPDSLTPLGPDDPNVYQPSSVVGMASRFTVAEILWDIHDNDFSGVRNDKDGRQLDPAITLRLIDGFPAGIAYPYLYTLLEAYGQSLTFSTGTINAILSGPEDQGIRYPPSVAAGTVWPTPISPDGSPGFPIRPPFTGTVGDEVDTVTPVPVNLQIGDRTQRYFLLETIITSDIEITLRTDGDLIIDLLRANNQPVESGTGTILAMSQSPARYIVRVRPADEATPQIAPFEIDIDIREP